VEDPLKTFTDHLQGGLRGDQNDLAAMKKANDDLKAALPSVKSEIQAMNVPSKQSAKDSHAAELKYLTGLEKISGDFAEIIKILEDKSMNQAVKLGKVQPIIERFAATAESEAKAIQASQAAFARDYNITVK
jgi:hypothetical protein